MTQLPLDLPHRPALGRGDFLVASANAAAVAWIDRWPDWPTVALALVGPAGSGKSHLAEVWRQTAGAAWIGPAELSGTTADRLLGSAQTLLVEGADVGLDARGEEELLHLYNLLNERRGHLLLTGRRAPKRWSVRLPDLASRLATATLAELGPPDDGLLQAVLVKLFHDRQLPVGPGVVEYLQRRIPRSFAAARLTVEAMDAHALAHRRPITVAVARDVLAAEADKLEAIEE